MKRSRLSAICTWIASLILLMGISLSTPALSAEESLKLILTSPKTQYLVDEPIFIATILRNEGVKEKQIIGSLDPMIGTLKVNICSPGDTAPHPYIHMIQAGIIINSLESAIITLAPSQQFSTSTELYYDAIKAKLNKRATTLLSSPGDYIIRAAFEIPKEWPTGPIEILSNELRLTVVEPEGLDANAHNLLQSGPMTPKLGPWNASMEQADCYEQLLRDYPHSIYALYARFYLAQIYECHGEEPPFRSTPEGSAKIRKAAELFYSAAQEAGDTPLGNYAMRLAARCNAKIGDCAAALNLFEAAFLLPNATDGDRLEIISWLGHVESGYFYESSGLGPARSAKNSLYLPLRRFASALGIKAEWDKAKKIATLSGLRIQGSLNSEKFVMDLNNSQRKNVVAVVKDGQMRVSPAVIAALMAEQRGKGVENAFSNLLAQMPKIAN